MRRCCAGWCRAAGPSSRSWAVLEPVGASGVRLVPTVVVEAPDSGLGGPRRPAVETDSFPRGGSIAVPPAFAGRGTHRLATQHAAGLEGGRDAVLRVPAAGQR